MSKEIIDIMLPAFAECLVLVGIHSYLGIHVIKRKVIFVDLALAQIAALGTTVAFLFGINPSSHAAWWFSLGFTLLGAAIFSLSRIRSEKIPQEAVIGLVYALAAAVAILVVDRAPHGAEHIKEILTGSILWVKWKTILSAALAYAGVGIFHYIFRDKFILISNNPEKAYKKGINVRLWDFLFYASFGIVITHSVSTAGVLLVFVFLVVPAIATIMVTDKLKWQLLLGWGMGTIVSVLGLYISYVADFPSGPTVVATYGVVLLLHTLIFYVVKHNNRLAALRNVGLGFAAVVGVVFFFRFMGHTFGAHAEAHASDEAAVLPAASSLASPAESKDAEIHSLLSDENHNLPDTPDELETLYNHSNDDFRKIDILKKWAKIAPARGYREMIRFLKTAQLPFVRDQVLTELKKKTGTDFGYDPSKTAEENARALRKMDVWWASKFNKNK